MPKQFFYINIFGPIHFTQLSACKIWAIISKHDRSLNIQSQDELLLINEQLGIYFNQSQHNAMAGQFYNILYLQHTMK